MANPNRDTEYLGKLQDYFAQYRNLPSYATIGELLGMASKSAVSALVKRLIFILILVQKNQMNCLELLWQLVLVMSALIVLMEFQEAFLLEIKKY